MLSSTFTRAGSVVDLEFINALANENQADGFQEAFYRYSKQASRNGIVLLQLLPDSDRKRDTTNLIESFCNHHKIVSCMLMTPEKLKDVYNFYSLRVNRLFSSTDIANLAAMSDEELVNSSLARLSSPLQLLPANSISTDPLGKLESFFTSLKFAPITGLAGDLPTITKDGATFAFFEFKIAESGTAQDYLNFAGAIRKKYADSAPGRLTLFSAFEFTAEASQQSQWESTWLGLAASLINLLIFWFFFRSMKPTLVTLAVIAFSALSGFAAVIVAFGKMHILALVFATGTLGILEEYCIHYFSKAGGDGDSVTISRARLSPMTLSFLTTTIGFIVTYAANLSITKQLALFNGVALTITYLIVKFLLPYFIPLRKAEYHTIKSRLFGIKAKVWSKRTILAVTAASVVILAFKGLGFSDDPRTFYHSPKELQLAKEFVARLFNRSEDSEYIIVRGSDFQKVLENEEDLISKVETESPGIKINAISRWLPSNRNQLKSVEYLSTRQKAYEKIGESLGLNFQDNSPYGNQEQGLSIGDLQLLNLPSATWSFIGKIGTHDYSVVNYWTQEKLHLQPDKNTARVISSLGIVTDVFRSAREKFTKIFLLIFTVVILALLAHKGPKETSKILSIPTIAIVCCAAALRIFGIPLTLFHVIGFILLFHLVIDYSYFAFKEPDSTNESAIMGIEISALTTIVSFGLLIFSSTPAAAGFGFVIGFGILIALLWVWCLE